jgi:putative peptidoglycan lipid II flippase
MQIQQPTANRQIARAAGAVMVAFILSNVVGLVRQILVLETFGTGMEMEAFNAANRVAETLFNLVAGGALASAFIPTFTGLLAKGDKQRAWKLASAISNLVFLIVFVTACLTILFSREVVRYILAPGFSANSVKESLTVQLLVIMAPSAILFSLSGLVMGILNAHQTFFIPALTPSMYQLGMIFGVVVLAPEMGVYGLAWGVVLGAGLHLVLQLPSLFRLGGKYFRILGLKLPEVREVGRLMAPRLLGVAVVQLNFWINTRIASSQPEGSVTGIVVAFTLMLMPQAAIAQSIAIAALPTLSSQYALGKIDEMRTSLAASLRGVLLLSIPASLGLILMREPIVRLLYQRGEFDARSTELVTWALLWYAIGLVGHSIVEIIARAFYAMHDTKTPVYVGVSAMTLNIGFSYLFAYIFLKVGWAPHGGMALANSLATGIEMVLLLYLMKKRLNGLDEGVLIKGMFIALISALLMAGSVWYWMLVASAKADWLILGGGLILGMVVYGGCLVLFRAPEVSLVWNRGDIFRRRRG